MAGGCAAKGHIEAQGWGYNLMVSSSHAAYRTIPTCEAILPPRTRMSSRPKLLRRAMFGSVVQLKLGSVLISMAWVTSEGLRNPAR